MRIVCSEREAFISLDGFLNQNEFVIISVEPFVNDMQILLDVHEDSSFKAICSYLYRDHEAFTIPKYVSHYAEIPTQTYFILTQEKKFYTAFFCLSYDDVLVSFEGSSYGLALMLKSGSSRNANQMRNVLVCARGENIQHILKLVMRKALELTGGMGKLLEDKPLPPHWLDFLGWESGLSLGTEVSHFSIMQAVESLFKSGYPPGFVLIDEGWQHLAENLRDKTKQLAMYSFAADPKRFPKGIKGLVDDLHHIGVKNVGVWHGMMGYKGGIHPDLAKIYDLPPSPNGTYFLGYDLGRTFQFFYDYYNYLREQGINFVKVGDQNSIPSYSRTGMDATLLYKNLQSSIQASASIHFTCAHFNTDSLRNENLFYWGNSRMVRAADDIDIDNPMGVLRAIRNNLTNSLWLQYLMQLDFDAWTTTSEQSETLAIFHALSGTINVIGDATGEHHTALVKKMVLPGGYIFKSDRPLTLCEDSIFIDPLEEKKVYKAFTTKGFCGIIGAFNLTAGKRTLHGTVSPKDVIGLNGEVFAVLSYHNGFIGLVNQQESLSFTLKPNQSDVFTFSPVKNGVAVLGCYPFFLAPGPIQEITLDDDSMHVSTLVASPIIIYCERQILEVRCNGVVIPWEYDSKRKTLSIDVRSHIQNRHSSYNVVFAS